MTTTLQRCNHHDIDEGWCFLQLGHPGGHWHSMFRDRAVVELRHNTEPLVHPRRDRTDSWGLERVPLPIWVVLFSMAIAVGIVGAVVLGLTEARP